MLCRSPGWLAEGEMMNEERISASVLVGFLGSGKTTLLNHLLTSSQDRRIAVIVNDFADLNIDSRLVRRSDERLVEMSNGCICCTLRQDLVDELRELSTVPGLEYILIESTGIGEPLPIAQAFFMEDVPERVRLDSVITVVDAVAFWTDFGRSDLIKDENGELVDSPLAPLLVDQLEFTNVVLLNKADLVCNDELVRLQGFVEQLNPDALVYRTEHGRVDPELLMNTQLFDYEAALDEESWDEEWIKDGSEAEEYGFHTFVYQQPEPLTWDAFLKLFEEWPDEVLRAKGFVAFSDHVPVIVSLAGGSLQLEGLLGLEEADIEEGVDLDFTEIVFIGRGMPVEELCARLDRCVAGALVSS
jgi:G3E family GTPase